MNFDFPNNNNSTVNKLKTFTVNAMCQLQISYYIVKEFIVKLIFQLKFRNHSHPDVYLYGRLLSVSV